MTSPRAIATASGPSVHTWELDLGTFAVSGSGPNCFATVLAAAGEADVEETQVVTDQFQQWLRQFTRRAAQSLDAVDKMA